MPIATHTLTGDLSALIGERNKVKATIHLNTEDGSWVNETDSVIRLGGAVVYNTRVGGDGKFTVVVPTSTDTGLQYEVRAEYIDESDSRNPKRTWVSGWFDMTGNRDLAERANNSTVRINPSLGAQLTERIVALEADTGTGEAVAALADRLDGVDDHGDVSGTLTLDPAKGFHIFDATGPVEIGLGNPPGYSLAFKAITGAADVTVDGLPDLELTDDAWATFVYYRGAWDLAAAGAGGGGTVEPVTDPPTQPGAVTVDPTADGFNLSWVASTVAAGYEVQIDGGAWVDSGAGTTHVHTGLAAGSEHSGAVRAYNSVGAKSTPRTWGPTSVDTVGLHEQILALEPEFYARLSRGSIEEFGSTTGTWTNIRAVTFDGDPLMDGETGAGVFGDNNFLKRTGGSEFAGAEKLTAIILTNGTGLQGGSNLLNIEPVSKFSVASGQPYYDENTLTHLFVINIDHTGASNVVTAFRDGVSRAMTYNHTLNPAAGAPAELRLNCNSFDGNPESFILSHVALIRGVTITQEQAQALAIAAGTFGNGGTA